ncbi:MAG: B12-binding domain-containing radical SAM protein [bacterium]|nr:B12-binding domain-containing radical SAM protein [bacterium]
MRILLVEPRTPETFWSLRHALRFVGKRAANPPLGLLTVAGLLPRAWSLRLVDLNTRDLDDADLLWADWVMVSGMEIHRKAVTALARRCRDLGRPLIGGGPLFGGEADAELGVPHVVVGEAEELAHELVADLCRGRLRPRYVSPRFPDLALTPLPRWDLLDLRHYATMSVQSCRGCPFDCEFCDVVALNGRRPRTKAPDRFVAELESLRERGWQGPVFVVDDNFVGDPRRCRELLLAVIDWRVRTGSRMTFLTEASVNMAAAPELLQLMVAAGFKKVFLGLETPSAASLRECRKLQNLRGDLAQSVLTIQAAGLEVMGGFIVGFDSDEPDIFQRQFEFIQRTGVVTAMVGLLQAMPRSRLYRRLAGEGRLRATGFGDNTSVNFNFEPRLDADFLVENYRQLMRRLYEPRAYYQRIRVFLDAHHPAGPRPRLTWPDLGAALRSVWVMGIRHRGRRAYWGFLATTLARHPNQFGVAMTMAIMGHHFRIVAAGL